MSQMIDVRYTGDGVDDVDRVLATIDRSPGCIFYLMGSLGGVSYAEDSLFPMTRQDVVNLRAEFFNLYGDAPRPPLPESRGSGVYIVPPVKQGAAAV
jgi:hypothetical protein